MRTRFCIALLVGASVLCGSIAVNGGQSGRLKNQRSTPSVSDTRDSETTSTAPDPEPERLVRSDDARPFPRPGGDSKIAWQHNMRSAIKAASDGNRVIIVDVYADWCGWCKKMDRTVYSDPRVASLSTEAVFLKLNAQDRGEGQDFARQNRVTGFPTTIILDHSGSVINTTKGYINSPERFIQIVARSKRVDKFR